MFFSLFKICFGIPLTRRKQASLTMNSKKIASASHFSYEQLLSFLAEQGSSGQPFTTKSVALYFGISVYQARYHLGVLHEQGMIERSNLQRGRKIEWVLS
ncbi:hypothetical protein FAP59_19270 [Morganella morganii]|nr:hypothetical protein [Morganella morganii]